MIFFRKIKKQEKKMSIITSNAKQIHDDPLNRSRSKMLYSFGKRIRFEQKKRYENDAFYDVKIEKIRSTGFGFGQKYDFTKNLFGNPAPNTYDAISEFGKKNKGCGFGTSRENLIGSFSKTNKQRIPGPGAYNIRNRLPTTIGFSFRGKNWIESPKSRSPGPGEYPVPFQINQKGTYFLSTLKNSCIRNFNSQTERPHIVSSKIPGPGAYEISSNLQRDGKHVLSKLINSPARKFGTQNRSRLVRGTQIPGPGNYKLPSEFGHYISKNVYRNSYKGQENNKKQKK